MIRIVCNYHRLYMVSRHCLSRWKSRNLLCCHLLIMKNRIGTQPTFFSSSTEKDSTDETWWWPDFAKTNSRKYNPRRVAESSTKKKSHKSGLGVARRKTLKFSLEKDRGPGPYVTGIAIAEEFNLKDIAKQERFRTIYTMDQLDEETDQALHCTPIFKTEQNELREFFVFADGAVVFWNVPQAERVQLLTNLRPFTINSYEKSVVDRELEEMTYDYIPEGKSKIDKNTVMLNILQYKNKVDLGEAVLERFAFSHGIAMSVKLGVCETLFNYIAEDSKLNLKRVAKSMTRGNVILNSKQVLKISGELASLRHEVNLSWDILSQDAYWDRSDLESIYGMTMNYFGIERRLNILNDRINYCEKLVSLSDSYLQHNHSSRLEWFIIALIGIEIIFELIHFYERHQVEESHIE